MHSHISIKILYLMCLVSLTIGCVPDKKMRTYIEEVCEDYEPTEPPTNQGETTPSANRSTSKPVDTTTSTSPPVRTTTTPKVATDVTTNAVLVPELENSTIAGNTTSGNPTTGNPTTSSPTTDSPTTGSPTTVSPTTVTTTVASTTVPGTKPPCIVQCPPGFKQHDKKCYKFVLGEKIGNSYVRDAKFFVEKCLEAGGVLASFHDEATIQFFVDLARKGRNEKKIVNVAETAPDHGHITHGNVVVGLRGLSTSAFTFDDGSTVVSGTFNFRPYEPDAFPRETHVRVTMSVDVNFLPHGTLIQFEASAEMSTGGICQSTVGNCPGDLPPPCSLTGKPTCEDGWKLYKEEAMCYKKFDIPTGTFEQFEAHCATMDALLPAVHSQAQMEFIRGLVNYKSSWIGARTVNSSSLMIGDYLDGSVRDYGQFEFKEVEEWETTGAHRCLYDQPTSNRWFYEDCNKGSLVSTSVCSKPAKGVYKPQGCVLHGKVFG